MSGAKGVQDVLGKAIQVVSYQVHANEQKEGASVCMAAYYKNTQCMSVYYIHTYTHTHTHTYTYRNM